MSGKKLDTQYVNTDFDLRSDTPFDNLHRELSKKCCELHYTRGEDDIWFATYEANDESSDATTNILSIVDAIRDLPVAAKAELESCSLREFNVGFECGDTWGFVHTIPQDVVALIAEVKCSLAVTLYPMRNVDGSIKS